MTQIDVAAARSTADREMVISRLIAAPRELVWRAFTQPEHLVHWWGPKGFTNTFLEADIREGGHWRYIMHGPDGTDYPNLVTFKEVVEPEKLAYLHGTGEENDPHQFESVITLQEEDGKTRVTLRSIMATPEALAAARSYGAEALGMETLDKWADYVSTLS